MTRRTFIEKSGILGASAMLPLSPSSLTMEKPTYKLGLQLFSIHQDMMGDPKSTLEAVKKMGYEDFEIYGFDPKKLTYYDWEVQTFKNLLDDMELTATSGHYGFSDFFTESDDALKQYVDQCIKGAKVLQSPYITWPWLAPELRTIENFPVLAEKLNLIGEQVNAAGLGFAYHNHGFEFEVTGKNGETGYDIILRDTDPSLVKLQMDMYWVMHSASMTPKEFIATQPGRFVMWHIKDMDKVTRDYTELGNGSINYVEILPDPKASGLEYYYIEQGGNFTHSAMKSAETSAVYFKKHLQKFL